VIFCDEFVEIVLPKRHRDCVGSLGSSQGWMRRHAWSPFYGQHNVPRSYGQHNMTQVRIAGATIMSALEGKADMPFRTAYVRL
jgi:hypothetical protein